ncbi:MAG TPA: LPS assembly lipoprotein LptE [Devosia sp.]|jgi:hypothetical protein|nr:LPS assembly lipoprotein LptE [Devosia sp.]
MSSSERAARTVGFVVVAAAALSLAGCSGFTPVYGGGPDSLANVALVYGKPNSRIDQVIYNDLKLRIPEAHGPAPTLTINSHSWSTALTSQTVTTAQTPQQMTVSAEIKLVDVDGKTLFSATRAETADYNTGAQVLANNQASADAIKRAADLLADTIRLSVLGALKPA